MMTTSSSSVRGGGHRKKVAVVRSWQVVESSGEVEVVEAGKHVIMRRTGLPARDLRILDPVLSYPSTILGRERAMVVNLEHIKAIITAHEVLFLNVKDPLVTPFVTKLQAILRHRHRHRHAVKYSNQVHIGSFPNDTCINRVGEDARSLNHLLPFEFVTLEACLEAACSSLDDEATRLEKEAHPALDKLTTKISTLNLERIRQIKSRLAAIYGRVQKVRDELEHLLDDDENMAEMYLTQKFDDEQQFENSSSLNELDDDDEDDDRQVIQSLDRRSSVVSDNDDEHKQSSRIGSSHTTKSSVDVKELEMILEAYFVHIEGTLNKLSNLREYVDDTEDYLNLMLDGKQNNLLQMGVMLTLATVVLSAFIALTGVFGMNISIELFNDQIAGMPEFMWTVAGGTIGCAVLYIAAIVWCKYKHLLE